MEFDTILMPLRTALARKAGAGHGDLRAQLVRADRVLSKRARYAGRILVEAEVMLAHPKTRAFVDPRRVQRAARILGADLNRLNPWDRRVGYMLSFLGTIAFMILVMIAFGLWIGFGR